MGVVYKGNNIRLGRAIAMKFVPGDYLHDHAPLERFQREAHRTSALKYPRICTMYDIDESEGQPFIVMEFLEGQTLNHRVWESERAIDFGN